MSFFNILYNNLKDKEMELIEELQNEHLGLSETLNKIKALGSSSEKGKELLFSLKSALLVHLEKEDDQLYPVLNNAAKKDLHLKETLNTFAIDMEKISTTALQFFDKYSLRNSISKDFSYDFGTLFAMLSQRIKREEKYIYPSYEELQK